MPSMTPSSDSSPDPADQGNTIAFRIGLDGKGGCTDDADRAAIRWTHYRIDDEGHTHLLINDRRLAERIAEAMTTENARPRATLFEDGLLVVLRGINCNTGSVPEDMVSMRAWVDGERVVTVSPRRVFAVEDVHQELRRGDGPTTAIEVFTRIATALVERMRPVVDGLEEAVDALHEGMLNNGPEEIQRPLSDLRHMTARLRRHMAPQRDALRQLLKMKSDFLSADDLAELSNAADNQSRYVEDADSVRERATVLQDELNNTVANEMNRNMYLMSIIAAVFLPLGLLTGLLGINVGGMPGTNSPIAFWSVCGLMGLIALAEVWYFRRRRLL